MESLKKALKIGIELQTFGYLNRISDFKEPT